MATNTANAPADPSPTPADDEAERLFRALRQPALIRKNGQLLPCGHRWMIAESLSGARAALQHCLGRPVHVRLTKARETLDRVEFGVMLSGGGTELMVALDPSAARGLVNAMTAGAGLRATAAPGPTAALSGSERGLVEYLALACVDAITQRLGREAADLTVRSFCNDDEASVMRDGYDEQTIAVALTVSGIEGAVHLMVNGWSKPQWAAVAAKPIDDDDATPSLGVALALPPVTLSDAEAEALDAGDVLLLGRMNVKAYADAATLMSESHWQLCRATILDDSATAVRVKLGPLAPCTPMLDPAPGRRAVTPLIGRASITTERLRDWTDGAELALDKHEERPVTLASEAAIVGRGELVILDGELGVRIVQYDGWGE